MNPLRLQGGIFILLALAAAGLAAWAPAWDRQTELLIVGSLILVLGVPHGALDTLFARELYGIRTAGAWLRFGTLYLLLAAAVVGLWFLAPGLFLVAFLAISAAHFSGDPDGDVAWWVRLVYGGAIIFIPALSDPDAVAGLFGLLVGDAASGQLMPWIIAAGWPWLAALVAAVGYLAWRRSPLSLELAALGIVAYFASPLISFTVFFCAMHSARHIIRTAKFSGQSSPVLLIAAASLPMLGVAGLAAGAWYLLAEHDLDERMIQIIFVGLAALTVPHMALVERIRLRGWMSKG